MSSITDFRRSSPAVLIGTAFNSYALGGVTVSSNGIATAGWVLVATGSNSAIWRDAISFGSNTNDVGSVGAMGASSSNSRADHVHRGVTSISHTSNTFYGSVILTTPDNSVAITNPSPNTLALRATGTGGGSGSGGAGQILAETVDTGGDRSITSATLVNIPTTAITATFTAPANGIVDVEEYASCGATTTANAFQSWGVLNSADAVIAGAAGASIVNRQPGSGSENYGAAMKVFRITGLTPGNSYTVKWAAANSTSGGTFIANANSPAVFRVVQVP